MESLLSLVRFASKNKEINKIAAPISDDNIENLLHLADMYDTPTATRRCEEFLLLFPTKIILRKKIRLAVQYRLGNLKVSFFTV